MSYHDVERLRQQVPELDVVSPNLSHWGATAAFNDKTSSCNVKGLMPENEKVEAPQIYYGRFLNEMDLRVRVKLS